MTQASKHDLDAMSEEARIVHDYLEASMKPDPETAATFLAKDVVITFTGGRVFHEASGPTGFNAMRYKWVKKDMVSFDVAQGIEGTVVYSTGTLFGEWPDGTAFEGNRYIDRFVVKGDKIVRMDVWNDSAERILTRRGITA
ncbi:MAG: nuclear transport factor 2 family protein [Pseudodonghicola sp.]|nr:nuclear transport factor 2 family protein [Pseudodonghicola sp.]